MYVKRALGKPPATNPATTSTLSPPLPLPLTVLVSHASMWLALQAPLSRHVFLMCPVFVSLHCFRHVTLLHVCRFLYIYSVLTHSHYSSRTSRFTVCAAGLSASAAAAILANASMGTHAEHTMSSINTLQSLPRRIPCSLLTFSDCLCPLLSPFPSRVGLFFANVSLPPSSSPHLTCPIFPPLHCIRTVPSSLSPHSPSSSSPLRQLTALPAQRHHLESPGTWCFHHSH